MKDIFRDLNEAQIKAVEHTEGPSMVIAGAGSGKTRVLTYRVAHLLNKGVDPFNVLALTFTNKAAREMKERVHMLVGSGEALILTIPLATLSKTYWLPSISCRSIPSSP